ncbi:Gfo/Idh/MocA family protein [Rhodothermus marinus]|uniref:Oxidoreductase domain protein n=1 Tax=Rhodothermus marinus (strain ATCC 43812 / DSM 4252 / R-10) TaxID=518766 RepID=D0MJG0_RHOM4|nr:Gfo/Idh/MocA family oxidoreductase [Rhodothermus marinus]ACY48618.1 oxidoreductase domain protein [Rhodothermus marinus DSM 4252]
MPLNRKLRYGMVGGGPGAFIGAVHRKAAALDGEIELVAGAFSSDPEKSRQMGAMLHLDPRRVYRSYEEMVEKEAALPPEERIDFVSIVTPNHLHYPIAKAFIEAGFHVVCDKPMTTTLEEAEDLCRLVARHNVLFALTHNYSGYPMVKQARAMVQEGLLGEIRKIVVEYPQGWLATPLEQTGQKQAAWRTDPKLAGAGALGDIGSHAEHLARYITGLELDRLCADITTFVPGRKVEDDANLLVHYQNGARGILYASQVSVGEENNLRIRVYGTKASLEWHQEEPNYLYVRYSDRPEEVYKRGNEYLAPAARRASRLPSGHPEAFIEAFANIYLNFARTLKARLAGEKPDPLDLDFPTVQDGARGVHFILTALESGRRRAWVDARYTPPGA